MGLEVESEALEGGRRCWIKEFSVESDGRWEMIRGRGKHKGKTGSYLPSLHHNRVQSFHDGL